jgi:glycine/D-amino acid oxidase-like deaminating enzyme
MSGHGFGIAPGIARIVADLVEQRSSSYSTNRFALNRFAGKKP